MKLECIRALTVALRPTFRQRPGAPPLSTSTDTSSPTLLSVRSETDVTNLWTLLGSIQRPRAVEALHTLRSGPLPHVKFAVLAGRNAIKGSRNVRTVRRLVHNACRIHKTHLHSIQPVSPSSSGWNDWSGNWMPHVQLIIGSSLVVSVLCRSGHITRPSLDCN